MKILTLSLVAVAALFTTNAFAGNGGCGGGSCDGKKDGKKDDKKSSYSHVLSL